MTPDKGIEQAEVMRRWHEQLALPKEERDILEVRHKPRGEWVIQDSPVWNFALREFRIRKRPRHKTVTVYLYRGDSTATFPSFQSLTDYELLGQADITYEEPNNDTR